MKRSYRVGFFGAIGATVMGAAAFVAFTAACGDDALVTPNLAEAGIPSLYVTYTDFGAATPQSLVTAFEPRAGAVIGKYTFAGSGGLSRSSGIVFSLEQDAQRVVRLGPKGEQLGAWNVGTAADGGTVGNPVQVIMVSATKAYVVLYSSTAVAVIDPSETTMSGSPKAMVSLASLALPADLDGKPEPAGAVYDPASKRLYVVMGNIDNTKIPANGAYYACSSVQSSIVAIDTASDALVSLGGQAPGGGIYLKTHNPVNSIPPVLDSDGTRFYVVGGGCSDVTTTDAGDGGTTVTGLERRGVEAVSLPALSTTVLLDVKDTMKFPSSFGVLSSSEAVVGFYGSTYRYDPRTASLGAEIVGGPDNFALDGRDLVGPRASYAADGGAGPIELVRYSLDGDGGSKVVNAKALANNASASVLAVDIANNH